MPRIARVIAEHYPHHVTQRGTNRSEMFLDDDDRRFLLRRIKDWSKRTDTKVWAYCLMGNHFHLLLVPSTAHGLSRCLHGITFRYAQYFNRKYGRSGRLWQNRYFSCPVDKDEYLWAVVRYIENNPVRAKLVTKAEDWTWSSAMAHLKGEKDEVLSIPDWLTEGERESYLEFCREKGNDDIIRKATSTGRPLGGIEFIEKIGELLGRELKPKKGGRPKKVKLK
ncbi:MAG: transposase [Deltaproteobacteria bacterium]|nr:MAG: transposase [Deltaproteobacteria bacterium]